MPLASALVAASLLGAGPRLLLVVALPVLVLGALAHRLPRSADAALASLLGVLALGAGLISRTDLLVVAGVLYLLAGVDARLGREPRPAAQPGLDEPRPRRRSARSSLHSSSSTPPC